MRVRVLLAALFCCFLLLALTGFIDPTRQFIVGEVGPGTLSPASGAGVEYVPPVIMSGDTLVYLFVNNPATFAGGGEHEHSAYDVWLAAAGDSVFDLADARADFAWATIRQDSANAHPNEWFSSSGSFDMLYSANTASSPGCWDIATNTRINMLVHLAVEDFIPAGSQVVSAELFMSGGFITNSFASQDSVVFALISEDGYDWYSERGCGAPAPVQPNRARASWDWMVTGNPAFGADPPAYVDWPHKDWEDLTYFYELCDYSDWSGVTTAPPQGTYYEYTFDITTTTQAIVNGETNNGWLMFTKDGTNATTPTMLAGFQSNSASYDQYNGFFGIKVIKSPYKAPFPDGKDFAFVFVTDDGVEAANNVYTDTLLAHDAAYTICVRGDAENTTTFGNKILPWLDAGMEVGPHSYEHYATYGLAYWHQQFVMADTNAATWDSLIVDASPDWLYQLSEDYDGDRREELQNFGKVAALPQNYYSPEVQLALGKIGYDAVRGGKIDGPSVTGYGGFYDLAQYRNDVADSVRYHFVGGDGKIARNFQLQGITTNIYDIVGEKTDNPNEAAVKANIRKEIHTIKGQDRPLVMIYEHDLKSGSVYPTYGLDGDELGWMLEEVEAQNGKIMTMGEYARWMKTYSSPAPTPPSYAQPDTFEFRADQGIWRVSDGVDGRFIRGFKDDADIPPDYPLYTEAYAYQVEDDFRILVNWSANSEDDLDGYKVYRSIGASPADSLLVTLESSHPWYIDYNLTEDVTYYYHVTAIDTDGNESIASAEVSGTPIAEDVYFPVAIDDASIAGRIDASGDSLRVEVSVTLNKDAHVKLLSWWDGNDAEDWHSMEPADTTAATHPSFTWHSVETEDDIMFSTAIPSVSAEEDSSITLDWTYTNIGMYDPYPSVPSVVVLEKSHNSGPFSEVTNTLTGVDSVFVHGTGEFTELIDVQRGIEYYRIYGIRGSYQNRIIVTEPDYLDSPYYNQAVRMFLKLHADDGVTTAESNTFGTIFVPGFDDGTGPAIEFVSAAFDTISDGASNVIVVMKSSSNQPANAWWQWKDAYDSDWWPETPQWTGSYKSAVSDTALAFTLQDTIHTEISTADLDSVYIRVIGKNKNQTIADPVDGGGFNFTRATAATWAGYTVISNHATYDSLSCDNWVSDGASAAINCTAKDSTATAANWGKATSDFPMEAYYIQSRLDFWAPRTHRLPVLSFGASTNFAGAKIDSAKLDIYTNNYALTDCDSLIVWGMTADEFQDFADNDASWRYKDETNKTRWASGDENGDGYNNLYDLCGSFPPYNCEGFAGEVSVAVSARTAAGIANSWNTPIVVTSIVQAQADDGKDLYFLLSPKDAKYKSIWWAISNEDAAEAQYRPRLRVWTSEDN